MTDLPESWETICFEDCLDYVIGGAWGSDPETEVDDALLVSCIRSSEFKDWEHNKGRTSALRKVERKSVEKRQLRENDLIVEISGGGPEQPVGRIALIDKEVMSIRKDLPKICTNFFRLARPKSEVYAPFIAAYLKHFYAIGGTEPIQAGSNNLRNLKFPEYLALRLPLPPLPEQHRIVAKIEALFSELDAGQDSLTRAQAQLRLYRQSLLKAAFQGRLTADWRAANPDKLESPETLLPHIRTERDARYKQALDDWQQALSEWRAGGEVGRKPAKPSRPPELTLSPEQNSNLPSGWMTVTVEGLLQEPLSNGRSVKDRAGGFPVLRLSAFNSGRLDLSAWKPGAWTSDEAAPWIVQEGDFFAARGNGSKHLVGIGALAVGVSEPVAYPDTMIRLSLDRSVVAPEYFLFVWNSRVMRDQIESAARTTAGIYKINQPHICGFVFPLPPREEQDAILSRLSPTLSQIEHLEIEITTALAKITALRQSILKQAFSGRLVPQDPADEPARALLARLRAAAPQARTKRKTTA